MDCAEVGLRIVRVSKEEGDCIVCLEMRADERMRRLISGELTNYRVVRTRPNRYKNEGRAEDGLCRSYSSLPVSSGKVLISESLTPRGPQWC
jgi:hypothetical protein